MKFHILLSTFVLLWLFGQSQEQKPLTSKEKNPFVSQIILSHQWDKLPAKKIRSNGPIFDTSQWAFRIDSTWGYGIPDSQKLQVFDAFWDNANQYYDCFVQLPLYNWDSIIIQMRAEINAGVSRGKFAGIIAELIRYINDAHTSFRDNVVNYGSPSYLGKPLFTYEDGTFGACLTMLADSTAVVYEVVPNHPFNLQPGDIIVGYNNLKWKELIPIILSHNLPQKQYVGSSPEATYHKYIQSVGSNWYLFDSIQIQKCNGNIESYSTDLMVGKTFQQLCLEQMPISGIQRFSYSDYMNTNLTCYSGKLPGTNVGYVSLVDCLDISGDSLYKHIRRLVQDSMIHGLVFDIRTNYGGSFLAYIRTMEYLHNGDFDWVGYGERTNTTNKFLMSITGPAFWYSFEDTDTNFSNIPIAILTGPNAVSAGDFIPLMYKHNPHVRTFGKSTSGAYGARTSVTLPNSNYSASLQEVNFFEVPDTTYFLSHTSYPVNQSTWFNRDSICNGVDNVVSEALQWINQQVATAVINTTRKDDILVYPNPANNDVTLNSSSSGKLFLINFLGEVLFKHEIEKGKSLKFSTKAFQEGYYVIHLEGKDGKSANIPLIISH